MKFSIILLLVAARGSSDMLVSSQDEPYPANEIKKVSEHWVNLRGSLVRRALLKGAITSTDSVDFHAGFDQKQAVTSTDSVDFHARFDQKQQL
jgi:hypothetical protein